MISSPQRLLGWLLFVLLLSACAGPQIFHPQLSTLDKGLTKTQAVSRLGLPPLSTHAASSGRRTFEFDRYRMNNGINSDLYLLAYERERLVYWGYVYEFRRQPDADLGLALNIVLRDLTTASGQ